MVYIRADKPGSRGIATATKIKVVLDSAEDAKKVNVLDVDGAVFPAAGIPVLALPARSDRQQETTKAVEGPLSLVADIFHPKPVWFLLDKNNLEAQTAAAKNLIDRGYGNVNLLTPVPQDPAEFASVIGKMAVCGTKGFGFALDSSASAFLLEEIAKSGVKFVYINADALATTMQFETQKQIPSAVLKFVQQAAKEFKSQKVRIGLQLSSVGEFDAQVLKQVISMGVDVVATSKTHLPNAAYFVAKAESLLQLQFAKDWILKRPV